jgi:ABC-type Fe3+ transport system permease subunit
MLMARSEHGPDQRLAAPDTFFSGLNFDIYSFSGIIWVHLVSTGLSTKVMLMTPAFRRMDASMEEASRMSGASAFTTLWRITVPAMTPVIVVVFLLSVIRIFSSFEIELLLGVPWSFMCIRRRLSIWQAGAAVGEPRLRWAALFWSSRGLYSSTTQIDYAPAPPR